MTQLDIFADPICPWSWIAKAELDRALAREGTPFRIRWHPFFLSPDLPAGGMERRAYLEAAFGSQKATAAHYLPILERGAALGLDFNLEQITRTPNTMDAQRLILWAELESCQHDVVQRLFEAYFRDGRDISDLETLADIADAAGLDAALIARLLRSDADRDDIIARDKAARAMGITAPPTFIVARSHAVPGAQGSALWEQVIRELRGA